MSNLTPEQLDLLKRLQGKINNEMGEWKEGDEFYDEAENKVKYLDEFNACWFNTQPIHDNLRIPKLIDWQYPERGLDGMIDWLRWQQYRADTGEMYIEERKADGMAFLSDPFTALLKALVEQGNL